MPDMENLVPGRQCAECTVCCTVPTIDKPELQKPAGATCRHCNKGCDIYETRPVVCSTFFCGWRQLEIFGDEWRPDKCGVYAELETDIPDHMMSSVGISLTLIANPLKTVRQPWFVDFIVTGIRGGVPLFLALPGPAGHKGAKVSLNTPEMARAASGSRGDVKQLLEKALRVLAGIQLQTPHDAVSRQRCKPLKHGWGLQKIHPSPGGYLGGTGDGWWVAAFKFESRD